MRQQEKHKLEQLAIEYDLDPQQFDYESATYDSVKAQILKLIDAPAKETNLLWVSQADWYNSQEIEQKVYIPSDVANNELKNCLVLSFNARQYGFAVKMLMAKFKGNLMHRSQKIIEGNKHLSQGNKIRILWFFGSKQATNMILDDLRVKHNLQPRVLRDSYLRRDDLHYANGKIFRMKHEDFVAVQNLS
jgi:hypothetical protein